MPGFALVNNKCVCTNGLVRNSGVCSPSCDIGFFHNQTSESCEPCTAIAPYCAYCPISPLLFIEKNGSCICPNNYVNRNGECVNRNTIHCSIGTFLNTDTNYCTQCYNNDANLLILQSAASSIYQIDPAEITLELLHAMNLHADDLATGCSLCSGQNVCLQCESGFYPAASRLNSSVILCRCSANRYLHEGKPLTSPVSTHLRTFP